MQEFYVSDVCFDDCSAPRPMRGGALLGAAALAALLAAGCGPKRLQVNPADVSTLSVRPASGQDLYCPGDAFLVELLATMKDGSSCSTSNADLPCLGDTGQVIDPAMVHLEASSGAPSGELIWRPDGNPLLSAATGLSLKAWLEGHTAEASGRSISAQRELRPVYQCQQAMVLTPSPAAPGANGGSGANVTLAVTTLSTPYYSSAALVRVEVGGDRHYFISPTFDQAIRIVVAGQDGGPGTPGVAGTDGVAGQNGPACADGANGGDGAPGAAGGPGGVGGPGGTIRLLLDAVAADKLRGRLLTEAPGGRGGPGGPGGLGGHGGKGGKAGEPDLGATCGKPPSPGKDGADGQPGQAGSPGAAGPNGPEPVVETAARETLFAAEMDMIRGIEAAPAKH